MKGVLTCIIFSLIFASCGQKDAEKVVNYATVKNYHARFTSVIDDELNQKVKSEIEKRLPSYHCAITNREAYTWPFFEEFGLDEKVDKKLLFPPHTASHLFKKYDAGKEFGKGDYLLEIKLNLDEGKEIYSFDMDNYKWKDGKWELEAETGRHDIKPDRFTTTEELIEIIRKTIIRYSFK